MLEEGQALSVRCLGRDAFGLVRLSRKALLPNKGDDGGHHPHKHRQHLHPKHVGVESSSAGGEASPWGETGEGADASSTGSTPDTTAGPADGGPAKGAPAHGAAVGTARSPGAAFQKVSKRSTADTASTRLPSAGGYKAGASSAKPKHAAAAQGGTRLTSGAVKPVLADDPAVLEVPSDSAKPAAAPVAEAGSQPSSTEPGTPLQGAGGAQASKMRWTRKKLLEKPLGE